MHPSQAASTGALLPCHGSEYFLEFRVLLITALVSSVIYLGVRGWYMVCAGMLVLF